MERLKQFCDADNRIQELVASRADKLDALEKLVEKMGAQDYVKNDVDQEVYVEIKKDISYLEMELLYMDSPFPYRGGNR